MSSGLAFNSTAAVQEHDGIEAPYAASHCMTAFPLARSMMVSHILVVTCPWKRFFAQWVAVLRFLTPLQKL